jgi:hypothetical protein
LISWARLFISAELWRNCAVWYFSSPETKILSGAAAVFGFMYVVV